MTEIIQLIRYEKNERLGSDFLSNKNDHWNSNLSKNRPTCVFIGSFSINEVAIFGCVIDKQYDSLSDLIISFGTVKTQITFYRLYNFLNIATQNILIIFICIGMCAKYGSLYSKYVHNMRQSTVDTGHCGRHGVGGNTVLYLSTWIYRGSDLWTPRNAL